MKWLRAKAETALLDAAAKMLPRHQSGRVRRREVIAVVGMLNLAERQMFEHMLEDASQLNRFEESVRSQNGEDGIIAEIFRRIGRGSTTFVEIGASDGVENCTAALIDEGWGGVWIEGDPHKAESARRSVADHDVTVLDSFVDRESVNDVMAQTSVADDFDLLVIDVDGNDAWIWEAVAQVHRPRVVVIEYNAAVGPSRQWVMPYDRHHEWDDTARHGASLVVLDRLGRSLGYDLVGCDRFGVNAFFVTCDESGPFTKRPVFDTWVPPRFQLPFGHPKRAIHVPDLSELSDTDASRIELSLLVGPPKDLLFGSSGYLGITVTNGASIRLGEAPSRPTRIASQWVAFDGATMPVEPSRSIQPWWADPGDTAHLVCRTVSTPDPGDYTLKVQMVQEDVRWLRHESNSIETKIISVR